MSVSRWRQVICPDLCVRLPRFLLAVLALFLHIITLHPLKSWEAFGAYLCRIQKSQKFWEDRTRDHSSEHQEEEREYIYIVNSCVAEF